MRGVIATALCVLLAQPVWSLSCLPPDVARDYAHASESEDRYLIVKGDLFFDETLLPKRDLATQSDDGPTEFAAWLDGHSLTPEGFTQRFERYVILRVECLGPWCGGATTGDHLAFLKQQGTEFVLSVGPCGSMSYPDPTKAQLETVTNCMRGEPCQSPQP